MKRPQITVDELIKFLQDCPEGLPIFCSESDLNEEDLCEFIHDEEKEPCVAIEITGNKYVTFGYTK